MQRERARQAAVGTFFNALYSDLYPPENMEKIYGVCETTSIGKLVYNAWITLKLRGKISEELITSAIAGGRLPQFFEDAIRSLQPNEKSYYSVWLTGEQEVDAMRFPGLPSGALFEHIEWNERALRAMADDDHPLVPDLEKGWKHIEAPFLLFSVGPVHGETLPDNRIHGLNLVIRRRKRGALHFKG